MSEGKLVFIVDDEEAVVENLDMFLKRRGYLTEIARSLSEALRKLDGIRPDIILLDLLLNGEEGTEIIKKAREVNPEVYIFILSGAREDLISQKAKEYGVAGFVSKPVISSQIEELLNKVQG